MTGTLWTAVASLPTASIAAAAATGSDGTIYAIGGGSAGSTAVYAYNPVTNTWSTKASLPAARQYAAATTGSDGTIYAIGGKDSSGSPTTTFYAYNPATNTWSTKASLPGKVYASAAATGTDGTIYAIGSSLFNSEVVSAAVVYAYSPTTDTWSTKASLPFATQGFFGAATGSDGTIYATNAGDMYAYSPSANTWTTKTSQSGPETQGAAASFDGTIYVFGGSSTTAVYEYDIATDAWAASSASLPVETWQTAGAAGLDGTIYLIGGEHHTTGATAAVYAYMPPSAPSAPTLSSPASAAVLDATNGVTFQPTYHSTDGQNCNAYTLRLKTGSGSYSYWKASTSSWSATEVWNTLGTTVPDGGTISIVIPHSTTLTNGNSYNWSVNTQESGANLQGTYAADSSFTARTPPTVTITAPTDAGTADQNSPPATWTETLASGAAQIQYEVVWETGSYGTVPGSGTAVADTGVVNSAALTAPCPAVLTNGTTYRMFVQIWQSGGQDSGWAHSTFTVAVTPPSTPTLTTATGTDASTGLPTVTVTVTVADSGTYDHTDTTAQLQASYDGGATWAVVRDIAGSLATALTLNSSGVATVVDGAALFGAATLYRANATGTSGGLTITSVWSATASVTVPCTKCWLVNPLDTSTALQVGVKADDTRTPPITGDITPTLGASRPVTTPDAWQAATGTFTWQPPDKAARDALEALLMSGATLLQRTPAEQGDAGAHVYFVPVGAITEDRIEQAGVLPIRLVKADWTERARP